MTAEMVPPVGDWIDRAPWRKQAVTLLVVPYDDDWATDSSRQTHTVAGKRELLETMSGQLFVVWTGKHHTDVRLATDAERAAIGERLV